MQAFFTDYLMTQRQAGRHTIASYRDAFKQLLGYARRHTGKLPAHLDLADPGARLIGAFLADLETTRGTSIATRNARLTAIHSLFRYASLQAPEHADLIARVPSIPARRTHTSIVSFLAKTELDALIGAPGIATWHGRRDRALLMLTAQTGLRVSELTSLTIGDIHLGTGPHVSCRGKNRKSRCTPLTPPTAQTLASWLAERGGDDSDPLFPGRSGRALPRDAVAHLLAKHVAKAAAHCPSLTGKTITPHTLRHSAATAYQFARRH
jgi:site-specific recombinase XerD